MPKNYSMLLSISSEFLNQTINNMIVAETFIHFPFMFCKRHPCYFSTNKVGSCNICGQQNRIVFGRTSIVKRKLKSVNSLVLILQPPEGWISRYINAKMY